MLTGNMRQRQRLTDFLGIALHHGLPEECSINWRLLQIRLNLEDLSANINLLT